MLHENQLVLAKLWQRCKVSRTKKWEKIPQLGEQVKQSCPPLRVSSHIIANHPRLVPGTNPADYLSDDVEFETRGVDEFRYQYGQPLVKPDPPPLTTMMQRFHDWYMKTCRESEGRNILTLRVREEHDLVGIELLNVPFDERVFQSKGPR